MTPSPPFSAQEAAQLFRLLGESARLHILLLLRQKGEASVGDLVAAVGLPRATVSNHLMLFRRGGVVGRRRAGHRVFYRITSPLVLLLLREVEEG